MSTAKALIPRSLHPLARQIRRRANLLIGPRLARRHGLTAEARFWDHWFDLPDADLAARLDPQITDPTVLECLAKVGASELKVIDVGAGPLSTLGTTAHDQQVWLTAVDPLADVYEKVLRDRGVTPLVPTQACAGEALLDRFAPGSFDLAYSENALDHSADPLLVIKSMLELVRVGGFVVLNHAPNEGDRVDYGNLHQWNFTERNGHCILWRPGVSHDLAHLAGATQRCTIEERKDGPRVICVLSRSV